MITTMDIHELIITQGNRIHEIDAHIEALREERRQCIIKRRKLQTSLENINKFMGEPTTAEVIQDVSNNLV